MGQGQADEYAQQLANMGCLPSLAIPQLALTNTQKCFWANRMYVWGVLFTHL